MNVPEIHPKLSHLSEGQLNELIAKYYAGEKTNGLLKQFNVDCPNSQLSRILPPIVELGSTCPSCGSEMVRLRVSRSSRLLGQEPLRCSICQHSSSTRCNCSFCKRIRETQKSTIMESKRNLINEYCWNLSEIEGYPYLKAGDLSLTQAVALIAFVRTCGFMDGSDGAVLEPFSNATIPFAPNGTLGSELIEHLINAGLISISKLSTLNGFAIEHGEVTGHYPSLVRWNIECAKPLELIREIESVALSNALPEVWNCEVHELWKKLALAECMEFYEYSSNQRGLFVSGEQSTVAMLSNLLEDFSVAQCYHVIYAGAKAAADFLVRSNPTRTHASNYMIGACQRWADRARAEKWDVSGYRRNYDLPRSMLSHVLHDVFLKIGEGCRPLFHSQRPA